MAQIETDAVVREIHIEASPETVFPFFTDPSLMTRWMGRSATLDPRPGGALVVEVLEHAVARGEYVEVTPPRRVVFTWGWEGQEHPPPPGESTVEIDLEPDGSGTLVRLTHRGAHCRERDLARPRLGALPRPPRPRRWRWRPRPRPLGNGRSTILIRSDRRAASDDSNRGVRPTTWRYSLRRMSTGAVAVLCSAGRLDAGAGRLPGVGTAEAETKEPCATPPRNGASAARWTRATSRGPIGSRGLSRPERGFTTLASGRSVTARDVTDGGAMSTRKLEPRSGRRSLLRHARGSS